MKITAVLFLLIITALTARYFFADKTVFHSLNKTTPYPVKSIVVNHAYNVALKDKAASLRDFSKAGNYNTTICFLVDMQISSGKNRFFVYNFEKDAVEMAALVTHGSGSDKNGNAFLFSNETGSNCTSLGKYKVGKSYNGKFGLAYKLHGLDKTNSNAFNRFVVLHAHACVPETEVYPATICESWGCPTVSPAFLQQLKKYIDTSEKPILLHIYK